MGAVWPTCPIIQHLTDLIWLGTSPVVTNANCIRIAAVLQVLKHSIEAFDHWYGQLDDSLIPDRPHPRFFPFPSHYTTNRETTQFSYIKPLNISNPACVAFLAKINPNSDLHEKVIIKFVQTHGEDAHQLLTQLNLAPKLHYCGSFGVEYGCHGLVEGKTAAESFGDDPLSKNIVGQLSMALDALHSHGYVFGDLR